ncbi:MAG: hypothetical protein WD711_03385 [Dongiaceae bacterium]
MLAPGFAATGFAATGFAATGFAGAAFTGVDFAGVDLTAAVLPAGLPVGFAADALAAGFAFADGFGFATDLAATDLAGILPPALAGFAVFFVAVFVTFVAFFFVVTGFVFEAALSRRLASAFLAAGRAAPFARFAVEPDLAAGLPAVLVFFFAFLSAPCPDAVLLLAMDRLSCLSAADRRPEILFAPSTAIREPFAAAAKRPTLPIRRYPRIEAGVSTPTYG